MNLNPWRRNRDLRRKLALRDGIIDELRGENHELLRALAELDRRNEELTTRRIRRAIDRQADDPPEDIPEWERELLDRHAAEEDCARRIGLWGAVEDPTGETP